MEKKNFNDYIEYPNIVKSISSINEFFFYFNLGYLPKPKYLSINFNPFYDLIVENHFDSILEIRFIGNCGNTNHNRLKG